MRLAMHLGRLEARALRRAQVDLELATGRPAAGSSCSPIMNSGTLESSTSTATPATIAAVRHRPLEQPRVEHVDRRGTPASPSSACLSLPCALDLQPARRQHRRQREADEQRHHDRERHRQAEALHEAADDAAHEADRHEDRDERQRRREHREADLLRRLDRRLELVVVLLLDEPVDVLEHDDRVVDDDADRQRQREHRHAC